MTGTGRYCVRWGFFGRMYCLEHPDGFDVRKWQVEEYKCTWMSTKRTPDQIWRWMAQVKAYCKGIGTHRGEYPTVLFRILYLMGDYKNTGPQYRSYLLEFSDLEIEENWDMLVNHARHKAWI